MPRKKPFSVKQKKKQLQQKRTRKRGPEDEAVTGEKANVLYEASDDDDDSSSEIQSSGKPDVRKLHQQPLKKKDQKYDPNRYRLHFTQDTREDIERRKLESMQPFKILPEKALEIDLDEIYKPDTLLDMPKRPSWSYKVTKDQLDHKEETYFRDYLDNIFDNYTTTELSYFEVNLETWRQLWRVLEMSDIVLLITDIRHPALHFSPALYKYLTEEANKHVILVLNKIDLAPSPLVIAWKSYFQKKFPKLHIVCFTSFPQEHTKDKTADPGKVLHKRRKRGKYVAVGPQQLLRTCEEIVQDNVNLSSWREKIDMEISGQEVADSEVHHVVDDGPVTEHVKYKDGVLTIGCVGYPNVGKSTLMNGLVGHKVVSVSKTPGHTKHFQTIFLTPTVKLCDCPGLVFPSLVQKSMQILAGIYPIAQVREPYSAVQFLCQRISLVSLLRLKHPNQESKLPDNDLKWSAYDICEAWAEKRGFITAKAARPDVYRAANNLLRFALEGKICLCMQPPGYQDNRVMWETHPDAKQIEEWQMAFSPKVLEYDEEEVESSSSETDDEKDSNDACSQSDDADDEESGAASNNPFAALAEDD